MEVRDGVERVSVLASHGHVGGNPMSPLGIGLCVLLGVVGFWWYRRGLARAQRLSADAQAGATTASLTALAAADWYPDQHDPTLARYFDGQTWTSWTRPRQDLSQPTAPARRGWASNLVGTLVELVIIGGALSAIAYGAYTLWAQDSGIPAQVKIAHCPRHGNCTAVWQQADGTQMTVSVHGPAAVPQKVDVHIHGDQAYLNSSTWGWSSILTGIVVVGLAGLLWWKSRQSRARRPQPTWPNDPRGPPSEQRYG